MNKVSESERLRFEAEENTKAIMERAKAIMERAKAFEKELQEQGRLLQTKTPS